MDFTVILWEVPGGVWCAGSSRPLLSRDLWQIDLKLVLKALLWWGLQSTCNILAYSLPWSGPEFIRLLSASGSLCMLVLFVCLDFLLFCLLQVFWMLLFHGGHPWHRIDQRGLKKTQWFLISPPRSGVYLSSRKLELASWLLQLTKCSWKDAVPFWSLDFKEAWQHLPPPSNQAAR